jgi:hypothetical protein
MSTYDELVCDYPLPDGLDPTGHLFQTQDTPDQWLERYVLTAEGHLLTPQGTPLCFHGTLHFYGTNIVEYRSEQGGVVACITYDGQAPWHARYAAEFVHGTLQDIRGNRQFEERFFVVPPVRSLFRPPVIAIEADHP